MDNKKVAMNIPELNKQIADQIKLINWLRTKPGTTVQQLEKLSESLSAAAKTFEESK